MNSERLAPAEVFTSKEAMASWLKEYMGVEPTEGQVEFWFDVARKRSDVHARWPRGIGKRFAQGFSLTLKQKG